MRGKSVILAWSVIVAVAVTVTVRMSPRGNETSLSELNVPRAGSPNRAKAALFALEKIEEGAALDRTNQPGANAAQSLALSAEGRTRDQPGAQAPLKGRGERQVVVGTADTASTPGFVDDSVVGQPFLVSQSIWADCEEDWPQRACEPNTALLAKMAEEPREEPWASSAEQVIRALVEREPQTGAPRSTTYTIRNLECRTSICFVETASHMEGFHPQLFYFERENRLKAGYALFSSEVKEDGTKVYVTLLPVIRTAFSTKELTELMRRRRGHSQDSDD